MSWLLGLAGKGIAKGIKKRKAEKAAAAAAHKANIADVGVQQEAFYKDQEFKAQENATANQGLNEKFSSLIAGRDYDTGALGEAYGSTTLRDPTASQAQFGASQDVYNKQGAAEQYQQANQAKFAAPTASQNYAQEFGGRANQESAAAGLDGSMDAYYDRARQQSAQTVNNQLAARGGFGSSAGLGMLMNAQTGINADQAQKAAQFGMQRAQAMDQNRLQGLQIGGTLARSGDDSFINQSRMGADVASMGQNAALQRTAAGQQAAQGLDATNLANEQAYLNAAGNQFQAQFAQDEQQRRDIIEQRDFTLGQNQIAQQRIAAMQQAGLDAATAAQLGYSAEEIAGLQSAEANRQAATSTAVSGGIGAVNAIAPILGSY